LQKWGFFISFLIYVKDSPEYIYYIPHRKPIYINRYKEGNNMSEMINDSRKRKELLKHMIKQLHKGEAPEEVKRQLTRLLGEVPYADVVEVEQELMAEGLPHVEILKLCDLHTQALKGHIDHSGSKQAPPGHPVHTFLMENRALGRELDELKRLFADVGEMIDDADAGEKIAAMRKHIQALTDVVKHYSRKENLLFPYLEKYGISGPSSVMWGKHDETRALLNSAVDSFGSSRDNTAGAAKGLIKMFLKPVTNAVEEMIFKEEQILFPMSMDTLKAGDWYDIYRQSLEIGFCLYDPQTSWKPEGLDVSDDGEGASGDRIQLASGSFTVKELTAVLNTIPFDLTFVDKDDTVRYFTQGRERIFARNRAILGRKVQLCHPPSSVNIVEQILSDFKAGKHERAAFWIDMHDKFISIEYFALHDPDGEYLGVLEVSQDLTEKRKLEGERRLLNYGN
jgi:DUF438 domain-containing protein